MRRREFLGMLGGAAVAKPNVVRAQQAIRLRTVGYLGSATAATMSPLIAAFVQRLRQLGWIEGRNIAIEYRYGEGRADRYAEIAAEFVRMKLDVILTHTLLPVLAAKRATSTIPDSVRHCRRSNRNRHRR